jgi:rSAM/selenodomain-associated transferase 1
LQKKSKDNGILFFVKYPKTGYVKSRLSNQIDKKFVVTLYKNFVEDTLEKLKDLDCDILICFDPPEKLEYFKRWFGKKYQYLPQSGENLGERMKNCFAKGFDLGYEKLVVIGSDSPDLPNTIIKDAFDKLNRNDCVIGPCKDGGYYLLGFTKHQFSPNVFYGIPWSTKQVFEKTMDLLKNNSLKIYELPKWQDVDTFDDLTDLYLRNKKSAFKKSKTLLFLNEYFHKTGRKIK